MFCELFWELFSVLLLRFPLVAASRSRTESRLELSFEPTADFWPSTGGSPPRPSSRALLAAIRSLREVSFVLVVLFVWVWLVSVWLSFSATRGAVVGAIIGAGSADVALLVALAP